MAALQTILIAFHDEPTNEGNPNHADNFAVKWSRRLQVLLQKPRLVHIESQEHGDGAADEG